MEKNNSKEGKRNFWFPVWRGIHRHAAKLGDAASLFLWYIDRTTKEAVINGDRIGFVLGGSPVTDAKVAAELGLPIKTLARMRKRLVAGGYIAARRTPFGYVIHVRKSKKFVRVKGENKQAWFPVWRGIHQHAAGLGDAIGLFLWCIDRTTKELVVKGERVGLVLGGRAINDTEIAAELGVSARVIRRMRKQLTVGGYIIPMRESYGSSIVIRKSKKFLSKPPSMAGQREAQIARNAESLIARNGELDRAKREERSPKTVAQIARNGRNKEEDKVVRNKEHTQNKASLDNSKPEGVKELIGWMAELFKRRTERRFRWTAKNEADLARLVEKSSPEQMRESFDWWLGNGGKCEQTFYPLTFFLEEEGDRLEARAKRNAEIDAQIEADRKDWAEDQAKFLARQEELTRLHCPDCGEKGKWKFCYGNIVRCEKCYVCRYIWWLLSERNPEFAALSGEEPRQ
jgi:hypothetical protein